MHYDQSIATPDSEECGKHLQLCPIYNITIPDSAELNTNIQQCVHIIWTILQMQCLFQISEVLFGSFWLPPSSWKRGRSGTLCTIKVEIFDYLGYDEFRVACFLQFDNNIRCNWYPQWFIFSFVYEEIWICNYAQLQDRCNMVPIWSQPKEVNQALMIGSCLVLFEVTVSIQTFTDTSPGSLVINMPIVVWYNDLVSTSLSYDFKDDFSDVLIYCIQFRQWFSKARYICWSTSNSSMKR